MGDMASHLLTDTPDMDMASVKLRLSLKPTLNTFPHTLLDTLPLPTLTMDMASITTDIVSLPPMDTPDTDMASVRLRLNPTSMAHMPVATTQEPMPTMDMVTQPIPPMDMDIM